MNTTEVKDSHKEIVQQQCTSCKIVQDVGKFYKYAYMKHTQCKTCLKARNSARYVRKGGKWSGKIDKEAIFIDFNEQKLSRATISKKYKIPYPTICLWVRESTKKLNNTGIQDNDHNNALESKNVLEYTP
jgi:transposase-like protein